MSGLSRRQWAGLLAMLLILAAFCLLRLLIDRDPQAGTIGLAWPEESFARFRWTALAVGLIVGSSLSVSGVLLQSLLRNPLAEPFILGISNGAGLGVMAALYLAHQSGTVSTAMGQTWPAVLGALIALGVLYALGQRRGWLDPITLVLVGVILSAMCGTGIMLFQHMVPTGLRGEFTIWLMGFVPEVIDRSLLITAALTAGVGIVAATLMGRAMDAATLGDDEARSVGLALGPLRVAMFLLSGVLTAMTVSLAGPIGFVGLIGPHVARLVLGPRHGLLVIGAAIAGAVIVIGSDVARQAIDVGAGRLPLGIFTALLGGPAFIWLLRSAHGKGSP